MKRPDLSDRLLAYLIFAAAIVIVTWCALLPDRAPAWKLPGSPRLYVIAVVGSLLLLVSVLFVFAKRTGRWGSPVGWFTAHVAAAAAGSVREERAGIGTGAGGRWSGEVDPVQALCVL